MKIGIMSMQRVANYGSFLQAYALKNIIKSLGHDVTFVDYKVCPPLISDDGLLRTPNEGNLRFKIKYTLKRLLKREIYFSEFYKTLLPKLGVNEKMHFNTKVDTLVIGSDEVFNCLQANPDIGYSPELFGKDANAKKIISYAASFGTTTAKRLREFEKFDEVKEYLTHFSALSLRDKNSMDIAGEMNIKGALMHLDPVLIYDFKDEAKENKKIKDYILVYSYAGRIRDEAEIKAIKDFAEKKRKKIVTVGYHQSFSDLKLSGDAFELIGYFKGADYVVTDTFHGTILSVITRKQFVTMIRDSNREKLSTLLDKLSLADRRMDDPHCIEQLLDEKVDYSETERIILSERERTAEYLKNNL